MDAFDPAVLVDGEGKIPPLSADDLGLDDDDDARAVKKFVAAWRCCAPWTARLYQETNCWRRRSTSNLGKKARLV